MKALVVVLGLIAAGALYLLWRVLKNIADAIGSHF